MQDSTMWDLVALVYFVVAWWVYGSYAKRRAQKGEKLSLSRAMRNHRDLWTERMLARDVRIMDASLLANQERVVGFFASTTLFLLAAVLTALTRASELNALTNDVPLLGDQSVAATEVKLLILLLILVYAFLKVTWSLRQYGFASVLVGSAPLPDEPVTAAERARVAEHLSRLMDAAGHDNNSCLRAYYFALAVVLWLLGTVPFVLATTVVVLILANREFRSGAVACIRDAYVPFTPDESLAPKAPESA